jgi:thiamine pyrophosphokinase
MTEALERWLVFFSPASFPAPLPELPSSNSRILAVDGGLQVVRTLGREPDFFMGDLDSLSQEPPTKNTCILPIHKDYLDGEAAIEFLKTRSIEKLDFYFFFQGRWDMTFTHFLKLYQMLEFVNLLCIHTLHSQLLFRNSDLVLQGQPSQRFSIIPLETMQNVSLHGAEFGLTLETIEMGSGQTLSNRFNEGVVELTLSQKALHLIEIFSVED